LGFRVAAAIVGAMRGKELGPRYAALVVAVWLATAPAGAHAGRVSCDDVLSRFTHEVSLHRGKPVDTTHIARTMNTTTAWVEHCLQTAGRRTKRSDLQVGENNEDRLEKFEDEEPEETAPEDVEEPGAKERPERPEKPLGPEMERTPAR
jgi:hypothetical protein